MRGVARGDHLGVVRAVDADRVGGVAEGHAGPLQPQAELGVLGAAERGVEAADGEVVGAAEREVARADLPAMRGAPGGRELGEVAREIGYFAAADGEIPAVGIDLKVNQLAGAAS